MPNTTNFGWATPADTDLVKDGAAAIRTLGSSIDTSLVDLKGGTTGQVLAKASNTDLDFTFVDGGDITAVVAGTGMSGGGTTGSVTLTNTVATAFDAAGDLVYGTGADTFTKLSLGTAGQILKVNSGATAPEWGAAAAGANWSLLNAGGTNLTAAATITVSGISGADKIMVIIEGASSANASNTVFLRFNSDNGSNYYRYGAKFVAGSTYATSIISNVSGVDSGIVVADFSSNAGSVAGAYCLLSGCNSSGVKIFNAAGGASAATGNNHAATAIGGYYNSSSTISSVSVLTLDGNWDAGKIYIYTSA